RASPQPRLRAGLCDRCMVTQELAKKKQNEYETSHFQSLQHIFILTASLLGGAPLRFPGCTAERLPGTFSPLPQVSQRIANQLHGTIALVRPGSKPCLLEKSPSGAAVSPSARKTPLPPERERSPSLEAYLTASKPDSPKVAPSYENLKLTARREQLCLLHKHPSPHQLGLASNCASADRDGSSFSSHLLRAKDTDGRTRSHDGWEDRAALLKLPAAMVYVRDQHLEEKLHLLKHRERLQHFLMQQCQSGQRVDGDPKPASEERALSPWPSITPGCKEERSFPEDAADGKDEKELWLNQDSSELREKPKAARDDGTDVPLDLSDSGRGRETNCPTRREPRRSGSPQPSPGESLAVPPARGPCGRHGAERDNLRFPYCWPDATQVLPGDVEEEEEEEEEDAAVVSTARVGTNRGPFPSPGCPALVLAPLRPPLTSRGRMALLCVKPTGIYLHTVKSRPLSPGSRSPPPLPSSARGVSVRVQGPAAPVPRPAGWCRRHAGLPCNTPPVHRNASAMLVPTGVTVIAQGLGTALSSCLAKAFVLPVSYSSHPHRHIRQKTPRRATQRPFQRRG
uniref:RBBP8 N-terminal like n=1 Tax=Buteo japonicus TaxID=224669 RepID=A0A8B9Z8Y4_9AVES